MADITVKAKPGGGQLPDRTWVREGEVFQIDESKFSARWMIKVEAPKPKPKPKPKAKAAE